MTVSEGDLRKAITYLQSAFRLKGEDNITEEDISEIAGVRFFIYLKKKIKKHLLFTDTQGQVRVFKASCCSARVSRVLIPAFAGSSVQDRKKGGRE